MPFVKGRPLTQKPQIVSTVVITCSFFYPLVECYILDKCCLRVEPVRRVRHPLNTVLRLYGEHQSNVTFIKVLYKSKIEKLVLEDTVNRIRFIKPATKEKLFDIVRIRLDIIPILNFSYSTNYSQFFVMISVYYKVDCKCCSQYKINNKFAYLNKFIECKFTSQYIKTRRKIFKENDAFTIKENVCFNTSTSEQSNEIQ